ncbi:hypothetical protein OHA91_39640 (plasmid) [Streptomyces erythrochromogenes]|uniref:TrbL/VirB6 plasmid conjugal transfer protein n=1 Tax=Streptomyces erythrochromogenes TaxID=285574 RepID=A0ABZ1QQC9_9ACTN|nr:hypothetical protein [Streptomyces erythrochromogenes]
MRTDRLVRATRVVVLLCALFSFLGAGAVLSIAVAADDPKHHASVGPPDPIPKDWDQFTIGLDTRGKYCLVDQIDDRAICRLPGPDDPPFPGRTKICEGADGTGAAECDPQAQKEAEIRRLEQWRKDFPDKQWKNYEPLNQFLTDCVVRDGRPFTVCQKEGEAKYPPPAKGPLEWVAGKFSEFASNALKEAASYIGKSVVWLLTEFATLFNENSSINLDDTGIAKFTLMMTSLSAVLAVFLLLIQFGKVAVSHQGGPAATALTGLAKWAIISSVYWGVAQTALTWSDAVSTWIINKTFDGGGSGEAAATKAMQEQLGTLFGGLITGGGGAATAGGALIAGETVTASAVGVVIVVGIVCILVIAALWVEILMRQVGIMLIVATMPITLAGQLSDATSEWWPKARNAFISLVLMKPAIVACFSIGFFAMSEGKGVQNMLVGFVMFLAAALCWPALAKFMVFTTNGSGSAMVSGWLSSAGSSASSMSGGYRPEPSGAGSVGGGSNYTKALESENATSAASPSPATAASGGGAAKSAGRFGGRAVGMAAFGLQVVAAGKDSLESGLGSTAAHAGLEPGGGGGRHVVIPPRRQPSPAPTPVGAPTEMPDPGPRPTPAPRKEG